MADLAMFPKLKRRWRWRRVFVAVCGGILIFLGDVNYDLIEIYYILGGSRNIVVAWLCIASESD